MGSQSNVGGAISVTSRGWSPARLPGIVGWWDASNAASITASGSPARVSQWNDLSGNGHDLTQGTGASQPTSGVESQNGKNAVGFTADGYTMDVTGSIPETPAASRYAFAAWYSTDTTVNGQVLWGPGSADGWEWRLLEDPPSSALNSQELLRSQLMHLGSAANTPNNSNGVARLYEALYDKTDIWNVQLSYMLNGAVDASGNIGNIWFGSAGSTYKVVGSGLSPRFAICEMGIVDAVPSAESLSLLRSYLNAKWAIY